ncbi:GroES-like protein [Auricularia subglabra TFB-10046 SS5]|nr:GroES-like protein [Auricularia subglabra TFB-10046 SS5]
MSTELPATYKAVKLYQPSHDIRVEDVPKPEITHPDDAIVRIQLAGLCGSDLHCYRGHEPFASPFICGHEFVGHVIALGGAFTSVNASADVAARPALYGTLKVGDKVISPFTSSCAECQPCHLGFTCRCEHSRLFGTPTLAGGQAQYILVPRAGGTLEVVSPDLSAVPDSGLLLLADIVPTGYFAAIQFLDHPNIQTWLTALPFPHPSPTLARAQKHSLLPPPLAVNDADPPLAIAVVGLGPVGVCSLVALLDFLFPGGTAEGVARAPKIVAVDPLELRRTRAQQIVSQYWDKVPIEFVAPDAAPEKAFGGVLEVVGNNSALSLAYKLIKPWGVITSVGVHNHEKIVPLAGGALYDKNVSLTFGRCPVRALLPLAADLLLRRREIFAALGTETALVERIVPLAQAREAYDLFDRGVWGKVLFDPWK